MTFFSLTEVLARSVAPAGDGLTRSNKLNDRERLEVLLAAGEIFSRPEVPDQPAPRAGGGLDAALHELARALMPRLGDCCAIDLLDEVTGEVRLAAVAHAEPESAPRIRETRRQNACSANDTSGPAHVAR